MKTYYGPYKINRKDPIGCWKRYLILVRNWIGDGPLIEQIDPIKGEI